MNIVVSEKHLKANFSEIKTGFISFLDEHFS